jgi:hypothetical protein
MITGQGYTLRLVDLVKFSFTKRIEVVNTSSFETKLYSEQSYDYFSWKFFRAERDPSIYNIFFVHEFYFAIIINANYGICVIAAGSPCDHESNDIIYSWSSHDMKKQICDLDSICHRLVNSYN